MIKMFGVYFDFSIASIKEKINTLLTQKQRAAIGVVDATILSITHTNEDYKQIINESYLNVCDGSTIAKVAGLIHHKKYEHYTGSDLFEEYVNKPYKQVFIGNTPINHAMIAKKLRKQNLNLSYYLFIPLPFMEVEKFDYDHIAKEINQFQADIIWVSLGAPKQEYFMHYLLPKLIQGVVIPVGAAFNFYSEDENITRAPKWMRRHSLEWLHRLYVEPQKQAKRLVKIFWAYPQLIWTEWVKS